MRAITITITKEIELININNIEEWSKEYLNIIDKWVSNYSEINRKQIELFFVNLLKRNGFYCDYELRCSFSYSQGDGCSFINTREGGRDCFNSILINKIKHRLPSECYKHLSKNKDKYYFTITNNSNNYVHSNSTDLTVFFVGEETDKIYEYTQIIEKHLTELYKGICSKIETFGYKIFYPSFERIIKDFKAYYDSTELYYNLYDNCFYNKEGSLLY